MEDPRVLLQYDEIRKVASEDLLWVASLEEADGFKSSVVATADLSYHFIWRRVLRSASEYPCSLERGDVKENLTDLSNSDRPSEPMASQCWLQMQVGFILRQSGETVKLLQYCNWTSTIAEQQHGSLAALKRPHPSSTKTRWWLVRKCWRADGCCRSRRRMNSCIRG